MKGRKGSNVKKTSANSAMEKKHDEFVKNIVENVKPGSTLVLGISGGPDSMYLLDRCLQLRSKLRLKIIVAHVNHGLRDKASDTDEKFVEKFCKRNKIPFHIEHLHLKKNGHSGNLEETGREARYKFFENVRKNSKAEWIVIAHHLNDNIETMLFNLIRGAHFNGIKAMAITSPSRRLLRPMLGITKEEILSYLKKQRIAFRLDASNNDTDFSRNWLRKNIIPLFPKLNANFEQTLKETLHNFAQTSEFLEQHTAKWLKKNGKNLMIELDAFLEEHAAFQKQILVHLYKKVHDSTKKLTNKHLDEILLVLQKRQANRKKEFGDDTFIEVVRELKSKPKSSKKKLRRYIRLMRKK